MTEKYYYEQRKYAKEYLIPYFEKYIPQFRSFKVLEVGCAEAGFIEELLELGMSVTGIELNSQRVEVALQKNPKLDLHVGDITKPELALQFKEKYNLIVMREVIEHLPNKVNAFMNITDLLNEDGYLFVSFPPKFSPFAGHQQVGRTFFKFTPYIHLLPFGFMKKMSELLHENKGYAEHLKLHYETGMAIKAFDRLRKDYGFKVVHKDLFIFRPIYGLRYGLPKIKFPNLPVARELLSFGYEALLQKSAKNF